MSSELRKKIEYAKGIKQHLAVLSRLTGRPVSADDLMDVESTRMLSEQLKRQAPAPTKVAHLPFSALRTVQFGRFVDALAASSLEPVHVWIDTTSACGLLTLASLLEFNFAFDFEDEPSGIIAIRTLSLANRMVLEFEQNEDDYALELQWSGPQWYAIDFPISG